MPVDNHRVEFEVADEAGTIVTKTTVKVGRRSRATQIAGQYRLVSWLRSSVVYSTSSFPYCAACRLPLCIHLGATLPLCVAYNPPCGQHLFQFWDGDPGDLCRSRQRDTIGAPQGHRPIELKPRMRVQIQPESLCPAPLAGRTPLSSVNTTTISSNRLAFTTPSLLVS